MALVICADCGKDVSDQAPACPHCGRPAPVEEIPTVEVGQRPPSSYSIGEPAMLLMISGGVLLAAGLVLLLVGQAGWASATLVTGIILGVAGRLSALMRRRRR